MIETPPVQGTNLVSPFLSLSDDVHQKDTPLDVLTYDVKAALNTTIQIILNNFIYLISSKEVNNS